MKNGSRLRAVSKETGEQPLISCTGVELHNYVMLFGDIYCIE